MPGTGRNILVTGGGGYIGSHCILQLLEEDFTVIAVDNFVNCIKGIYKKCFIIKKQMFLKKYFFSLKKNHRCK
jgi:UDP-glucose 4-epimerase